MKKTVLTMIKIVLISAGLFLSFAIAANADSDGVFVYSVSNSKATITGHSENLMENLVIPDTIGGYPVVGIGSGAFKDCTVLKSVTVPNSVTSIGNGAFQGCNALEEIALPKDTYGTGVASVFGYIFGYTLIENFSSSIVANEPNNEYANKNAPSGTTYQNYYTTTRYSNGYVYTYYYYYIPSTLKKVTITNDTAISDNAFYNCINITQISLNDKITTVGLNAFYNNAWYNNQTDDFVVVGDGLLIKYNSKENNVVFPDEVKRINNYLFYDNSNINNVVFHEGIVSIGGYAFRGCSGISTFTVPNSVTSIGSYAFNSSVTL